MLVALHPYPWYTLLNLLRCQIGDDNGQSANDDGPSLNESLSFSLSLITTYQCYRKWTLLLI